MLIDSLGDVIVTNDENYTREMDITQPAARMLVETAKKRRYC